MLFLTSALQERRLLAVGKKGRRIGRYLAFLQAIKRGNHSRLDQSHTVVDWVALLGFLTGGRHDWENPTHSTLTEGGTATLRLIYIGGPYNFN